MIAALYVESGGVYFGVPDVDPWDAARDARLYAGPHPVVAHPPCGPWGKLRHLHDPRRERLDDTDCGPIAVAAVRRWGGVLEHPKGSRLFCACAMPRPGELPDAWGGVTIEVAQCDFGHPARKRTWLYIVGTRSIPALPSPRDPTHWCSGFRSSHGSTRRYKESGSAVPHGIKVCSAQQRRRTPPAFRDFLLEIARSSRRSEAA